MTGTIPEQHPIADSFTGYILRFASAEVLSTHNWPETETMAEGNFTIRYGLRYLGRLHISIVPGLVVLDYGDMLTGEEAWDFLIRKSNLYPRSEVVGYRNDGTEDMVFIRVLDMAVTPEVLAYGTESDTKPLAKITALIAEDASGIPDRLLQYLPRYPSLSAWQAESNS